MIVHPLFLLDGQDVTCDVLTDVTVTRGRNHPAESIDPATLQATLIDDAALSVARGQSVVFTLNAPATDPTWNSTAGTWDAQSATWDAMAVRVVLFRGVVSDVTAEWSLEPDGLKPVVKLVAVDPLGSLANRMVGDEPWPAESCVARAQRIAALVGITLTTYGTGPQVIARDVDRQAALDLLDDVAASGSGAGGIYFDPSTSQYVWTLGDERNTTTPAVILTDCQLLDSFQVAQSVTDVSNDVTVTYGATNLEARAQDLAAIAAEGYRHAAISTQLNLLADAQARATDHVRRYAVAAWKVTELTVPSQVLDTAESTAEKLLRAPLGARVRLSPLPHPAPARFEGYLEGYTFEMTGPEDYRVTLNLSPQQWTGPLLTWDQAAQWSDTWDHATGSWNEALQPYAAMADELELTGELVS